MWISARAWASSVTGSATSGAPRALSYELLWGQPGGWDYLTEENAARSVDLLPELTDAVVRLLAM
jgi:hypothetical protein